MNSAWNQQAAAAAAAAAAAVVGRRQQQKQQDAGGGRLGGVHTVVCGDGWCTVFFTRTAAALDFTTKHRLNNKECAGLVRGPHLFFNYRYAGLLSS